MARDLDPFKLSSPRIFLVRMTVFLILCVLLVVILYKQIWAAFLANPGLNALIICVLIFLGLLGTFWGLIETVGSVGKVIEGLKIGGDAGQVFDTLKEGLAAPLGGMGISFSSSLFGLAGSLVLGFLDLQTSQAQNRFYIDLEDWLSTTVRDLGTELATRPESAAQMGEIGVAIERLKEAVADS